MKKIYNLAETGTVWLAGTPETYAKVSHTQEVYLTTFNCIKLLGIFPNLKQETDFDKIVESINLFVQTLLGEKADMILLEPIEFLGFDNEKGKAYPAKYVSEFLEKMGVVLSGTPAHKEFAAIQSFRLAARDIAVTFSPVQTRRGHNRESNLEVKEFKKNLARFWITEWVAFQSREIEKLKSIQEKHHLLGEIVEHGVAAACAPLKLDPQIFSFDYSKGALEFA